MQWLKEMTVDFCESPTGCLSDSQLSQAPAIMKAWSLSKVQNQECALAVEQLLKRVIEERLAGNDAVTDLTTQDYNCLVEGWARSGAGTAGAERCEQILTAMQAQGGRIAPNLPTFKAVLMAWRQATQQDNLSYGPIRAQRILEWMIRLYATGDNKSALPDQDCFDICLQTWSRSGHAAAPEQTEKILGAMERLFELTGLETVKPRTTSFNAVLAAWSKSGRPEAAERATNILTFLENPASGDAAPDAVSYTIVLAALAKSPDQAVAARKADVLVRHAVNAYCQAVQADPSHAGHLDSILFNTAMGCWAKANVAGSFLKARSMLDRQIALYETGCDSCKPDVYGFTSVIAACAATQGSKKERWTTFGVALDTYQELTQYDDANHVTYGTMLKACAKLLPAASPVRRKWVRQIFRHAVQSGRVGDMVLSRLREAAPPDIFRELMQGHHKKHLPPSWTCNVNANGNRRKKALPANKLRRKRAEV
jgi:hypothetical protein